jgi:hypothetical protein
MVNVADGRVCDFIFYMTKLFLKSNNVFLYGYDIILLCYFVSTAAISDDCSLECTRVVN